VSWLTEPFGSDLMQRALLEAVLAGALCGAVGVHVVLRRLSFFTMALTHATFPGLVIAALLGISLFFGTAAFGVVVVLVVVALSRRRGLDSSTATGVVLAGGFALGVVLISSQQGFTRDLTAFLVGSILTVEPSDLAITAGATVAVLGLLVLLHKELVLAAFDPVALEAMGYRVVVLDVALLIAIEITVVTSIPAMGTILAVALIVAPASAARLWTDRVGVAMVASAALGAASGVVGLWVSHRFDVAAGAAIALVAAGVFGLAWVASPGSGRAGRDARARARRIEATR
jgi:ABC-type Mn2+/Zn2+ transport system permease subunit